MNESAGPMAGAMAMSRVDGGPVPPVAGRGGSWRMGVARARSRPPCAVRATRYPRPTVPVHSAVHNIHRQHVKDLCFECFE